MTRKGLFWLAILLFASCTRFKGPPTPPGVPHGAKYLARVKLWEFTDSTGAYTRYYSDGQLARSGKRKDGQRTGQWQNYSLDGHFVTSSGLYDQNWRNGTWEFRDSNGRLYLTIDYRLQPRREYQFLVTQDYGNENGRYNRYFLDGQLEETGTYRGGYQEGAVTRYYPNGQVWMTGHYSRDRRVGSWQYFYPEGRLERHEHYREGRLDGPLVIYYPSGNVYYRTSYAGGKDTGAGRIFPDISPVS